MKVKLCKDCNGKIAKDNKTGKWWCIKCKEAKDDYLERYRIVVMGKNVGTEKGPNNLAMCFVREWEKMGHEVIEVNKDILFQAIPEFDMENCLRFKKPIDLRLIEYRYDPDFIFIEQMYNRFDTRNVKCPVIYQHREYTHFPDIDDPDILLGSYPFRLHFFEQYRPWNYSQIKYRDDNFVAVYPPFFPPVKNKVIEGISFMGWSNAPDSFIDANGIIAKMIIENQMAFMEECRNKGYLNYIEGNQGPKHYQDMLGKCEAILIDGGFINGFGRTLFEAMAMKTLCIVRIQNKIIMDYYKKIGLTDEMCYFIIKPVDIGLIFSDWDLLKEERAKKVEKAYEWVMKYHTYEVRARETLEKFEAWKRGETKMPYFMGYARRANIIFNGGVVEIEQI